MFVVVFLLLFSPQNVTKKCNCENSRTSSKRHSSCKESLLKAKTKSRRAVFLRTLIWDESQLRRAKPLIKIYTNRFIQKKVNGTESQRLSNGKATAILQSLFRNNRRAQMECKWKKHGELSRSPRRVSTAVETFKVFQCDYSWISPTESLHWNRMRPFKYLRLDSWRPGSCPYQLSGLWRL